MIDKQRLKIKFSERLNEACDDLGWPRKHIKPSKSSDGVKSRAQILKEALEPYFEISQPGVRKWFIGESVPDATNIAYVSEVLGVNQRWLTTGEGDKRQITGSPPQVNITATDSSADTDDIEHKERLAILMGKRPQYASYSAKKKHLYDIIDELPDDEMDSLIPIGESLLKKYKK